MELPQRVRSQMEFGKEGKGGGFNGINKISRMGTEGDRFLFCPPILLILLILFIPSFRYSIKNF